MEYSFLQQQQSKKDLQSVKDVYRRIRMSLRTVYNMSELDCVNSSSIARVRRWPSPLYYFHYGGVLVKLCKPFFTPSYYFYASEKKFLTKKMGVKAYRFGRGR